MKIHEYQAKQLLEARGVAIPRGFACFGVADAQDAAKKMISLIEKARDEDDSRRARLPIRESLVSLGDASQWSLQ